EMTADLTSDLDYARGLWDAPTAENRAQAGTASAEPHAGPAVSGESVARLRERFRAEAAEQVAAALRPKVAVEPNVEAGAERAPHVDAQDNEADTTPPGTAEPSEKIVELSGPQEGVRKDSHPIQQPQQGEEKSAIRISTSTEELRTAFREKVIPAIFGKKK